MANSKMFAEKIKLVKANLHLCFEFAGSFDYYADDYDYFGDCFDLVGFQDLINSLSLVKQNWKLLLEYFDCYYFKFCCFF